MIDARVTDCIVNFDHSSRTKAPVRSVATVLPEFTLFEEVCRKGLSVIYPLRSANSPDPAGWKFGAGWPPSYSAFGRMRSLLAVQDALELRPNRVLEVAAGGAGLSACLAKVGCSVTVNDLLTSRSAEAIKEYTNGAEIEFIGGNLFDLSAEQIGKFDLVIACEVIEHVAHPLELLTHLKTFLTPEGRVLLTTPNGSHFRNKLPTFSQLSDDVDFTSEQFKPDADGHLFLLTPDELLELASDAGLLIERLNCWGTPIITGHFGLRLFSGRFLTRIAYNLERLVQHLNSSKLERFCTALSVVLRQDEINDEPVRTDNVLRQGAWSNR